MFVVVRRTLHFGIAGLLAALAAGACSSSTSSQIIPDISGAWTYSETTTSRSQAGTVACNLTGTLTFSQDGETFVGAYNRTVSCSAPGTKNTTRGESGSIARSVVTEHSVTFRIGDCQYQANVDDVHPDRLTGSALCTGADLATATVTTSAGAWLADRIQ